MPGYIENIRILKTLGKGASCKVKLGFNNETNTKVAVKILSNNIDKNTYNLVMSEVQYMQKLNHINIIKQLQFDEGIYKKDNGTIKNIIYIVLELAQCGELFDFIYLTGPFNEKQARYLFKQFLNGIMYCHEQGITHRDLKPENILLDNNYNIKIADFGLSGPIQGRDGSGYLTTKIGTMNYMAPEIHLNIPYQGEQIDVFAAAIILFIMVASHSPFTTAQSKDPFYRCMAAKKYDIFWKTHCKHKYNGQSFFSDEFKDLIQMMLELQPSHRITFNDILVHPWMQGDIPDKSDIINEFTYREISVKKQIEKQQYDKSLQQKQINNQ